MDAYKLRYAPNGFIMITPQDDCARVVDAMLETNYDEEFCLALDFDPHFVANLMEAGFLVMSAMLPGRGGRLKNREPDFYFLLPKLHLTRSVIFWEDLRETKTARRLASRYELKFDQDFDVILQRCAEIHGEDWLTSRLRHAIQEIRKLKDAPVRPVSFGLYRDGVLKAGEFGVIAKGVYTSYSGYREEDSAGTVQLLLTGRYLRDMGYAFWDLGMPMDYKDRLGARNILPDQFVKIFRDSFVATIKK